MLNSYTYKYYPLRFTRSYWEIPLYTQHTCQESCQYIPDFTNINEENPNGLSLVDNPEYDKETGKCIHNDKYIKTPVNINDYQISNPEGIYGNLHNCDEIVINDNEIYICINFPITNEKHFLVKSEGGFSLRELLQIIKYIYKDVYREEENTATINEFKIEYDCECIDVDIKELIRNYETKLPDNTSENCSICYSEFDNTTIELGCNHCFHKKCVQFWVDKGKGFNCPLCRALINPCDKCDNNRYIIETESFVVLPQDLRDNGYRNVTDGIYGIYDYDLDQLNIMNLWYNNIHKVLILDIEAGFI